MKLWKDVSIVQMELFAVDTDTLCDSGKGAACTCSSEGEDPQTGDFFPVLREWERFPWV